MTYESRAGQKLQRALKRGYFRTLDLFSGCGGLSLGFHRAGFKCVSAVELDGDARSSHRANFGRVSFPEPYAAHSDITRTKPEDAVHHLTTDGSSLDSVIDVVIGGPPCQAFSRLGRARLWELAAKKHAHALDVRATMYHHFLEFVAELEPIAFVMENVREIGKFAGRNVAEEIAATAEDLGYDTRYTLLNAVWFGVPQLRERMFIIGVRKELSIEPTFPVIRHRYDLPVGYSTSRAGSGRIEVLEPHAHYMDHHETKRVLNPAVTASDALIDLPAIFAHLDGRKGRGVRRKPEDRSPYLQRRNSFSEEMRHWPDFENPGGSFSGHVIRYTPRDYPIFARMAPGDQYPAAIEIAEMLFNEKLAQLRAATGRAIPRNSKAWQELRKATVPPYPSDKYPNKFRKMWPDHPARTLPAHLGKDSYSHIHYDDRQARAISLREAARLQSFPDGFELRGSMNSQLRQIGNAVPPLLAFAVAGHLRKQLSAARQRLNNLPISAEAIAPKEEHAPN